MKNKKQAGFLFIINHIGRKAGVVLLFLVVLLSSCRSVGTLTFPTNEYGWISIDNNEIQKKLLQYTPVGTDKKDVLIFIKKKLRKRFFDHGDYINVILEYHKYGPREGKSYFETTAIWRFTTDNILTGIEVHRGMASDIRFH